MRTSHGPLGRVPLWCAAVALALLTSRASAGEVASPFNLRGLDGRPLRLSEYKGQPVVLDFWATWCNPCRATMPTLEQLHDRFRDQGLVVVGLSVDDGSPATVRRFAEHMGITFRIAMASESVLDDYGPIRSVPTTVFINRRGEIVRRVVGYVDPDIMEGFVDEILAH